MKIKQLILIFMVCFTIKLMPEQYIFINTTKVPVNFELCTYQVPPCGPYELCPDLQLICRSPIQVAPKVPMPFQANVGQVVRIKYAAESIVSSPLEAGKRKLSIKANGTISAEQKQ